MKIVHLAAELAPLAKVGGLGDVLGGLSTALVKESIDVEIILPKYKNLNTKYLKNLKLICDNFKVFEKDSWRKNKIYSASLNDVKIILIENQKYFNRSDIYGYEDDIDRFLYFTKSAMEFLNEYYYKIDILQIHDWHTSFAAPLYKDIYSKETLEIKKIVLSIHNLKYQGLCKPKNLNYLGLNGRFYLKEDKLQDPLRPRTLNLLKGGFIYSDKIIPVSENYAHEILIKENSCNLYKTIQENKKKIKGIINGIDANYWNPAKDPYLKYKYPNKQSKKIFQIKSKNKEYLQKILHLQKTNAPLICCIGRLVTQKGPKLIKHAILQSLKKQAQFVLLGTPFNEQIFSTFKKLKQFLKTNKNASLNFDFNEKLSHEIFSAADFIIIPSLFEPCGLTQMIALRYGCIPIVRLTGGLADTVFDLDNQKLPRSKRNGFTFKDFSFEGVDSALNRAIDFWYNNPQKYNSVILKNMKYDFSWKASAKKYVKEYKKLLFE